jgi:hypothetical protein
MMGDRPIPGTEAAELICEECRRFWRRAGERWRMYVLDVDDEPAYAVIYCPDCARREFGSRRP